MKSTFQVLGATILIGAAFAIASCGDDGGAAGDSAGFARRADGRTSGSGGGRTQAALDTKTVTNAVPTVSMLFPLCTPVTSGPTTKSYEGLRPSALLSRLIAALPPTGGQSLSSGRAVKAFTATPPATKFGDCGGTIYYPSYSHSNGVTTATVIYDHYCTISDSATGARQITNGSFAFVNTATPSDSGPITSRLDVSTGGVTFQTTADASGTETFWQSLTVTDFSYIIGVPGGSPTASNPDVLRAAQYTLTGREALTSRQTNFSLTTYDTPSGGSVISVSGRGYTAAGGYYDWSTPTPLTQDSSGKYVAGQVTLSGADGTTAVASIVPGKSLQLTLALNGSPVTSLPACK